jgi:G3E family GTPase
VYHQFSPDRIIIEPSGVGKLSDVVVAVQNTIADLPELELNSFVTVADASKVKVYMKNFGEFYNNQIESAGAIILSRTQKLTAEKLAAAVELLRQKNPKAPIITTPWDQLSGQAIRSAMEGLTLEEELLAKMRAEHAADEAEHEHHHHHDHDHEHDHDHDHEHDHEHEHDHHHDHDHEHHHDHGPECTCGCHDHEHHHHHADEVFTSWGVETLKVFQSSELDEILTKLDSGDYGHILRAKGMVPAADGSWLHFDYVPEEHELRKGPADYTGRLCVIGAELKEDGLKALFGV